MSESAGMSQQTGGHPAETLSNRLDELNRQIVSSMETAVQEFHRDLSDLTDKAGTDGRQKAATALLDAFARIDEEDSQSGVLIALLEEGRRFASRTAFFLLQPTQVVVWGSRGFGDSDNSIASRTIEQGSPWDDLADGGGSLSLDAATCEAICSQLDTEAGAEALLVPFVIRGQLGGAFYADRLEGEGAVLAEALQLLTHDASQAVELVAVRNRGASPALRRGAGQAEKLSVWQPEAQAEAAPESAPTPEAEVAPAAVESETVDPAPAEPEVAQAEATSDAVTPDFSADTPTSEPMAAVDALAAAHLPQHEVETPADDVIETVAEAQSEEAPVLEAPVVDAAPEVEAVPAVEEAPAVEEVVAVEEVSEAALPDPLETSPNVDVAPALSDISAATQPETLPEAAPTFADPEPAPAFAEPEAPTFAEPEPAPAFAEPEAPTFAEPEPVTPAFADPEPPAVTEPEAEPDFAPPSFASDSFAATSAPSFEAPEPAPADFSDEAIPEPELEDTSTDIWSLEEDDDDDEPTVVGQAVVPTPEAAAPQPAAPEPALAMDGVGQETVRLDLAALQGQASATFGGGVAEPAAPQPAAPQPAAPEPIAPPPVAPEPVAPPPVSTSFAQPETAYVPPPAPEPAAAPSFTDPASGGFVPPEPKPEPAASGSNEVRPPEDHQGPGLAFASSSSSDDALHEEARRLARLLVSEIKLYNEEVIEEGKRHGDIYERLKDDIDRSRQMYQERIHPKLQSQDDYFYQELVQRLAGGNASLLGMSP